MVCLYRTFYPGYGTDRGSVCLVIFFWITIIFQLVPYIWTWFCMVKWFMELGYESPIFHILGVHLIALNFGIGWTPYALLLSGWEKESKINRKHVYCCYMLGCFVCLLLEGSAMSNLFMLDHTRVRDHWRAVTKEVVPPTWPEVTELLEEIEMLVWVSGSLNVTMVFCFSCVYSFHPMCYFRKVHRVSAKNWEQQILPDMLMPTPQDSMADLRLSSDMSVIPTKANHAFTIPKGPIEAEPHNLNLEAFKEVLRPVSPMRERGRVNIVAPDDLEGGGGIPFDSSENSAHRKGRMSIAAKRKRKSSVSAFKKQSRKHASFSMQRYLANHQMNKSDNENK